MKFKPKEFVNPSRQRNQQKIDKWNPPVKKDPIPVPRATIEPNQVSSASDPLARITRKPRG